MAYSNTANVLKYFDFEKPTDPQENFKATCHHCTTKISGSLKVTSNFVTHMKVRILIFIIVKEWSFHILKHCIHVYGIVFIQVNVN